MFKNYYFNISIEMCCLNYSTSLVFRPLVPISSLSEPKLQGTFLKTTNQTKPNCQNITVLPMSLIRCFKIIYGNVNCCVLQILYLSKSISSVFFCYCGCHFPPSSFTGKYFHFASLRYSARIFPTQ